MKSPNVLILILLAIAGISAAFAEPAQKAPSAVALNRTVSVTLPDSEQVFHRAPVPRSPIRSA